MPISPSGPPVLWANFFFYKASFQATVSTPLPGTVEVLHSLQALLLQRAELRLRSICAASKESATRQGQRAGLMPTTGMSLAKAKAPHSGVWGDGEDEDESEGSTQWCVGWKGRATTCENKAWDLHNNQPGPLRPQRLTWRNPGKRAGIGPRAIQSAGNGPGALAALSWHKGVGDGDGNGIAL